MTDQDDLIVIVARMIDIERPKFPHDIVRCRDCRAKCYVSLLTVKRVAKDPRFIAEGYVCNVCALKRKAPDEVLPASPAQAAEIEGELSPAGRRRFRLWHLLATGKLPPTEN